MCDAPGVLRRDAEVECKSVAEKGQRIHQREALEVFALLRKELTPYLRTLNRGLLIRAIVPNRLPSGFAERRRMCENIRKAVLSGATEAVHEDLEVRLTSFDPTSTPLARFPTDSAQVHEYMHRSFGVENKHLMIGWLPNPLVLSLESSEPDNLVEAILGTVKRAASTQLTQTRAGIICVKLESLSAQELEELGDETGAPSVLRRETSSFLNRAGSAHVICVGFFSDGPVTRADGIVTQGGRSYFFQRPESPLFNAIPAQAFGEIQDVLPPV